MSVYKEYGIYGIKNTQNNKIYIGKTMKNFGDRWDCHKAQLRKDRHENPHLQRAWNKYGENAFEFLILYSCHNNETVNDVNLLEINYINAYKEKGLAYNIAQGGDGGMFLGKHLPESVKRKIGEKNRVNMTGRKLSAETKKKMSESQKARYGKWTQEERLAWGQLHGRINKGRKWTEEQRLKLKNNKNGAKYSIEDVKKIRRLREVEGLEYSEIAKTLGIPKPAVYLIATYRRWKDIS